MTTAPSNVTRESLLDRFRRIRADIASIFDDADHWNRVNPSHAPIDPDPNGELRRIAVALDRTLADEAANDGGVVEGTNRTTNGAIGQP